jgi:transcriptional regulator with XRE-family HTH domain
MHNGRVAANSPLGTRIRRARERRRWTQKQLADVLSVDRKTVDNWENGRTTPRNSIGALEEALGGLTDPGREPEPVFDDPSEAELWSLATLTEDERWDHIHRYRERKRQAQKAG